ncbi:MAG TPA: Ig-like domain-containing protein [Solirubrobacterales bacterium]
MGVNFAGWLWKRPLRPTSSVRCALAVGAVCAVALGLTPSAQAEVTRSGTLQATVIDDFGAGQSTTRYSLESGGEEIPLRPTKLRAEPGDQVVFSGELRDGRLVGAVRSTASEPEAALIGTPSKVAVLLIRLPGDPAVPWSPEITRSKVFTASNSANAFYKEESYGEISLTGKLSPDGDVFGWFSLSGTTVGCPFGTWDEEADEAAADAGIDLSGYQHVIYVFPSKSNCGFLGIANVNGIYSNINGNVNPLVIAHELGHNLGLHHANSLTCSAGGKRVTISETCTSTEYGDPFDTMGNIAYRHNNGWNLDTLGILAPENVKTAAVSGTYSLRSALVQTTEPTMLRIPRALGPSGTVSSWYSLEIRETGGFFENVTDSTTTGVSVRIPELFGVGTELLDANPATASFGDAPLKPGQTLDAGPVQIKTISAGAGQAVVQVEIDSEPPSAPDDLQASVDAEGVELSWVSSDNFGIERYYVFRDGEQVGSVEAASFLDTRAPSGDHDYTVVAEDVIGNQSDPSEPLTVPVPVVSGPTCAAGTCKLAYRYSGAASTWTVPPGVDSAFLTVEGAGGGGGDDATGPERGGGSGSRVWATLEPLSAGQVAELSIGGHGERDSEGGAGGFNGGGAGGRGGGGGGYTSVKLDSALEVIAAGGGGGGIDSVGGPRLAKGGGGGSGFANGSTGGSGGQVNIRGAILNGGEGGEPGGSGGLGGEGGELHGPSTCPGGAEPGVFGASGGSLAGGGGVATAGGGGGGGSVGGGQGGSGASDECGARAASGGGGGGSSFVAPGRLEGFDGAGDGDGWVSIEYDNPVDLLAHSYVTFEDEELDVAAAQGVLAGSSIAVGVSPTLSLADPPDHGSLILDLDDGSFTYEPDVAYLGTDSFDVRLADAAGHYDEATAVLHVAGPPSALISSPPAGGTYVVGQSVPTVFSCSEGTGGTGLSSCNDSNGTASSKGGSGHLDTAALGDHIYTVKAVSKDGLEDSASISYKVVPPPEPPVEKPKPPPPPEPKAPPLSIGLSGSAGKGSLRALLRTGELDLVAAVSKAATLTLTGKAKLKAQAGQASKPVAVFKKKTVSLPGAGESTVTLKLSQKGRQLLRDLTKLRLTVDGQATSGGETAAADVALTLQR